ncbi:MAG: hypothetical protein Q4D51_13275 [Eubacteriales bacterium]|nr:hypothetical protein [Eubacteriales bacterium]
MIRPLEMQMLLPRTESVGHTQHNENQKVVNVNLSAAEQAEKEIKQNNETVIQKNPTEFAEYQYDARESNGGSHGRSNGRKKKQTVEKNEKAVYNDGEKTQVEEDIMNNQPRVNIQL